jgi:hypothetical protein
VSIFRKPWVACSLVIIVLACFATLQTSVHLESESGLTVVGSTGRRFVVPPALRAIKAGSETVRFSLNYPLLTPRGAGSPLGYNGISVWLSPYPSSGTRAQALIGGKLSYYHSEESSGAPSIFVSVDKQTRNVTTVKLLHDAKGNLLWFEDPGSWSHAYRLEHGDPELGYFAVAMISKDIKDSPTLIDQRLTSYIEKMGIPQ